MWPVILEKAWSKIIGSYSRTKNGQNSMGMMSVSGTYTESYVMKDKSEEELEAIYQKLKESDEKGYLMTLTVYDKNRC